jgi:phenylalanyl-tRNA synthetase beta chain
VKISLDWLRDYVSWEESPEELAAQLTCIGLNVENIEEVRRCFPGVCVAKVVAVAPHPNADRLRLCTVHDGRQTLEVVCGAPNVREELHVLLATPGAVLPGPGRIKKTKIRGIESAGMICSARELDLGSDADGIMELSPETEPGLPADDLYGFRDVIFDIEVTPNRPDWLYHVGVAREVAAFHGAKVQMPPIWSPPKQVSDQLDVSIEIENFADCPRYTLHKAQGVRVGSSPAFMQNRLRSVGARPVNNVVDITNYVLYELGQPLHAFDLGRLNGSRIYVKRAAAGMKFATLDGCERELTGENLVIADAAGPVALAGIMGGLASEVRGDTETVLLESAFFQPMLIRRASRGLGIVTESSYRFEREADWDMVEKAAHRALFLLQEHTGAHIVQDWADRQDPDRKAPVGFPLRMSQVNRLLGTQLNSSEAAHLLQRLSLSVVPVGKASDRADGNAQLMVKAPSFRRDLKLEVDLIEEIARLHGYDHIPSQGRVRGGLAGQRRAKDVSAAKLRHYLAGIGYSEMVTSSLMGEKDLERMALGAEDDRRRWLSIVNPHHGGQTLLRTTLLPSLLWVVKHNSRADNPLPLRFFQLGKVFRPSGRFAGKARRKDDNLLPEEPEILQLAIAGRTDEGLGGIRADLLELNGLVQSLSELMRIPLSLAPHDNEATLTPGQQWAIHDSEGRSLGFAGAVSPALLAAFDIEIPVVLAEIAFSGLALPPAPVVFRAFSRFPAVKRDLSLIVPDGVRYDQVAAAVRQSGGPLLESLELFDFYKGTGLPKSTFALGIRLKFRSDRGNLKGKTVDECIERINQTLARELAVSLRS